MKKFIIITVVFIVLLMGADYLYYSWGNIFIPHHGTITYFSKAENEGLYIDQGNGFEAFEIKGVNIGLGKPGYYATERAITKEEYLRWFKQIQEMGANVIRIYTLAHPNFYEAFYEYNQNNPTPLYLLHGVWVDDYLINSTYSAADNEFYSPFLKDCKVIVDVIHGRHKDKNNGGLFALKYDKDISPWVYGYIWGIEWESSLVTYTDYYVNQLSQYDGEYLYTENASNFEIILAQIGEAVISYETDKYGTQRVFSFSNWPTTDPLEHEEHVKIYFEKSAKVDVEHIKCKNSFSPGQFASYHIYPYYPDYYSFNEVHEENTYLQYLKDINKHHTIPVVITEFGVSSSRGMAAVEDSLGRNQGGMSEIEQGHAIVSMYEDIMQAGSQGGIVFTWQDEWFKRTWNTMANINLNATPYWSDYQTNEQYFGLLSFDPGTTESICYVDGDITDWKESDIVTSQDEYTLSMKYDEKFIYFMVKKDGFSLEKDVIYIPIDTTHKSGSTYAENLAVETDHNMDFVIEIKGMENSRVWVQEYYDTISALFYENISSNNFFSMEFPKSDTANFVKERMLIQKELFFCKKDLNSDISDEDVPIKFQEFESANAYHYSIRDSYETGKLTYGNANPHAEDFNSLADFCAGENCVEIKIPWQLLNFADPSQMYIHDDYYESYGVEYIKIRFMNVGIGDGKEVINMQQYDLDALGKRPDYHERLKASYYILKDYWKK